MVPIIPMPRFQAGKQGYNFQPVANGLETIRQQRNQNAMLAQRDEQHLDNLDMREAQMEQAAQHRNAMLSQQANRFEADQAHRAQVLGMQRQRMAQASQPKPTTAIREYQFAMEQRKAAGQPPVQFGEWKRMNSKAGATQVNVGGQAQTKGRIAADKKFGQEYSEFVAGGGFADAQKNLQQLGTVVKDLESGKELTGAITGNVPDTVRQFTNPASIDRREAVEEVVQRNLRIILGAQFTAKEGENLIARAYNQKLDEKTNAVRLRRLMSAMDRALKAKLAASKYFEKNGTLTGYKGSTRFTMADIEKQAGLGRAATAQQPSASAVPSSRVQSILDKYGVK